jgi:hypothetical protein
MVGRLFLGALEHDGLAAPRMAVRVERWHKTIVLVTLSWPDGACRDFVDQTKQHADTT